MPTKILIYILLHDSAGQKQNMRELLGQPSTAADHRWDRSGRNTPARTHQASHSPSPPTTHREDTPPPPLPPARELIPRETETLGALLSNRVSARETDTPPGQVSARELETPPPPLQMVFPRRPTLKVSNKKLIFNCDIFGKEIQTYQMKAIINDRELAYCGSCLRACYVSTSSTELYLLLKIF